MNRFNKDKQKMKKFSELGLSKEFLNVLNEVGFENPSEIQEKAIPVALAGKDIIGGSATGSGKTLAFSSSIIEGIKPGEGVQALIMAPTRELAEQVAKSIRMFSKGRDIHVVPIYGGVDIENQIRKLKRADIVVGTPGRILDHMKRTTLDLIDVKYLVLDEVDRMFDMGFHRDVESIIEKCPQNRQTMLFSATISPNIDHLAQKYTKDPEEISVESYVDASKLKQIYYDVPDNLKFSLLVHLLKEEKSDLVMVFCSTRRNVDFVAGNLIRNGIHAKAIHGGIDQKKRNRVIEEFHGKGVDVLICTDVAARGLDIKGVSHVYNYDLPTASEDYVHRIGRTARAGKEGVAINILASRDYENFGNIQRDESIKIEKIELPFIKKIRIDANVGNKRFGGRRGNSRSRDSSREKFGGANRRGNGRGRFKKGMNLGGSRRDGERKDRFSRRNGSRGAGKNNDRRGPKRGSKPRFNKSGLRR